MSTTSAEDSQGRGSSLEKQLRDFAENTTLHGARHLSAPNAAKRLIWGLVMIASLCYCFFQVYQSVSFYLTWPVSTLIATERTSEMPFPAVTLCNFNTIDLKRLLDMYSQGKSMTATEREGFDNDVENMMALHSLRSEQFSVKNINDSGTRYFLSQRGSINLDSFSKLLSSPISDMLSFQWPFSCQWNGKQCGPENFSAIVTERLGQCYTFNPGKKGHRPLNATLVGASSGLRLRLNIQEDTYSRNFYQPTAGLKVIIHDQKEYPFVEELGFAVQPGVHTFSAVRRKQIENLEHPYKGKCGIKELNFSAYHNISYSRPACIKDCEVQEIIRKCGCQPLMQIFEDKSLCSALEMSKCVYPNYGRQSADLKICFEDCPEPCNYVKYDTQLSYAAVASNAFVKKGFGGFPTDMLSKEIVDKFDNMTPNERKEFFRDNIVTMDIYYEDLSYQLIRQQKAFDYLALIGNIGGFVGLFLGMSMLTMFEFLDLLFRMLLSCFTRQKTKRVVIPVAPHSGHGEE